MRKDIMLYTLGNKILNYMRHNSSTILACTASLGVVVTSYSTLKATPKAIKLIEKVEREEDKKLTITEKVKVVFPVYIPSILIGTSTIICVFGINTLNKRSQASLASAYALVDNSYKEYKNKLRELYGEEVHRNIVDAIAIEKAKTVNIHSECLCTICDLSVEDSGSESKLFYDEYSKRYFQATIEQVLTAEYHLNRNFALGGCIPLNEFYEFLGLKPTEYGDTVGWSICDGLRWIDFNHHKTYLEDGMECYIIQMVYEPSVGFDED